MRIAQVAPLYECVPPKWYGGTERVVSYLTECLIDHGHQVTLFASGDSKTEGKLIAGSEKSLRLNKEYRDPIAHHVVQLFQIMQQKNQFDIIHFHTDYLHLPLMKELKMNHITTLHGRLDIKDHKNIYLQSFGLPFTSISINQRKPVKYLNWAGNVYHGIPENLYQPEFEHGKYLIFIGRTSPEKGLHTAIKIAIKAGIELKIIAKISSGDQKYYDQKIKPLLKHPGIEFIGEKGEKEKELLLKNALGLIFPIQWPEPFGLVMIEALACGTPVVAFDQGSVSEIIENGITGYIVKNEIEGIKAVRKLPLLNRRNCIDSFKKKFTTEIMTNNYLNIYRKVISGNKKKMEK